MGESDKPSEEHLEEIEEISEKKGFVWTPESVKNTQEFIEHLADKYLTFKKNEAEARQSYLEASAKHNRRMTIALVVFLVAIVIGMSILTLKGSVTGDALLFLVGTITGYVLLFIQRLVFTTGKLPVEEKPEVD